MITRYINVQNIEKNSKRQHCMGLVVLVMFISFGCSVPQPIMDGPTTEETEEVLEIAWLYHDYIAEELVAEKEYTAKEFNEAHEWLLSADEYFVNGRFAEAYTYASNSLQVFRQIVEDFSQKQYIPEIQATLEEVEQIVADDPDNPLVEFIPTLQEMLANAHEWQKTDFKGSPKLLEQMRDEMERFRQLQKIIHEGQRIEREIGDVSFETGEYHLSDEGKELLKGFAEEILAMEGVRRQDFPEQVVIVKIKVVGYTDEQGFRHDSEVARELLNDAQLSLPSDQDERDKVLNQLLSEKRAMVIIEHLEQEVSKGVRTLSLVQVEKESIGKGEAIPPSVAPPYPEKDARRRISRIYSYVFTK